MSPVTLRSCAIFGSILLALATFAPTVTVPVIGGLNLFFNGSGDGIILLPLALIALTFSLYNHHGWQLAPGLFGVLKVGQLIYFINGVAFQTLISRSSGDYTIAG